MTGRVVPTSLRSSTGLETARIAEVWAPGDSGGMRGSGYLLDGELVLTAGHVADRAGARGCEVRPLGATKWVRSEVVWRGAHCDAALLRVRHPVKGVAARVRLGRFGTDQRADVRAVGFPEAQAKELGRLSIVDTEDVFAQVALLSGIKTGTLTLHVAGSTPAGGQRGRELWGGMSGAALFGGPLLVGIIIRAPGSFGTDRLEAVPVDETAPIVTAPRSCSTARSLSRTCASMCNRSTAISLSSPDTRFLRLRALVSSMQSLSFLSTCRPGRAGAT